MPCSFLIGDNNFKALAILSDKYDIEALQMDVRVNLQKSEQFNNLRTIHNDLFGSEQRRPSNSGNLQPVRYSLLELEHYCRSDKGVFAQLQDVLIDPKRGLKHFTQECSISSVVLNGLLRDVAILSRPTFGETRHCIRCSNNTRPIITYVHFM